MTLQKKKHCDTMFISYNQPFNVLPDMREYKETIESKNPETSIRDVSFTTP